MDDKIKIKPGIEQSPSTYEVPPPPYSSINDPINAPNSSFNDPYSSVNGRYSTIDGLVGAQTLEVNYRHWKSDVIITTSTGEVLFTSQSGYCSTRLEFLNRARQLIGSSKSSNFSSRIDVGIRSAERVELERNFEMHNSASILGGSPKYRSPAFGEDMTWKNKAMSTKITYELVDGKGNSYASFQSDPRSRIGRLEIGDVVEEDRINEIFATLVSLLCRKLRNIEAATLAAIV